MNEQAMMEIQTLPGKPSELLTVALQDLVQIEATPGYAVDMRFWHTGAGATCAVCLAGAVIAVSLGASRTIPRAPGDYESVAGRLRAIDRFRIGACDDAFFCMGLPEADGAKFNRRMPDYSGRNRKFHNALAALIDDLREAGF